MQTQGFSSGGVVEWFGSDAHFLMLCNRIYERGDRAIFPIV